MLAFIRGLFMSSRATAWSVVRGRCKCSSRQRTRVKPGGSTPSDSLAFFYMASNDCCGSMHVVVLPEP